MKTIILAGGFGTRIGEYSAHIPKPMIEIGGRPILWHIMNIYSYYGYNDFVIALGYKGEVIKDYFLKYSSLNSDFFVDLGSGEKKYINENHINWKVTLIDTGAESMTGGRVKRLEKVIGNETFMLTYGDAVSNANIADLVAFHKAQRSIGTVTAVHPPARFGELSLENGTKVTSFKEKPHTNQGWINGGFFVFEPDFFKYIAGDATVLEKEPLEILAKEHQLYAFKHDGFWQCMDTLRDKNLLEEIWNSKNVPWMKKINKS